MKINKIISAILSVFLLIGLSNCTDLEENILDEDSNAGILSNPDNIDNLVTSAYASLRAYSNWGGIWSMQEMTTDEAVIPTRGTDWYDNGAWQEQYLHNLHPDHTRVISIWNDLHQGVARANSAMSLINQFELNDTTVERMYYECRFLRALYVYSLADLYGQVPFRDIDDTEYNEPSEVMQRLEAVDFAISEIKTCLPYLGNKEEVENGDVTKCAAWGLLSRIYLNYEVYSGESKWQEAYNYADTVLTSNEYTFSDTFWDMFAHDALAPNEFILYTIEDDAVNLGQSTWIQFNLHYNQLFGNYTTMWNGAATTPDFLATWDRDNDVRFKNDSLKKYTGFNQGFLVGQQYNAEGDMLYTRDNEPLVFVEDFVLTNSAENMGVRVIKFAPDPNTPNPSWTGNDFPIIRLSEMLLNRAEASFRMGNTSSAMDDINSLRALRSAENKTLPQLTSISEDDILDERGYELYWEGHRRIDLVRFGKYGDARYEKPADDADKTILPIPTEQLTNPNLVQNPNY